MKIRRHLLISSLVVIYLAAATGCQPETQTAVPPQADLTVSILYPLQSTEIEMGHSLKSIVKVSDPQGEPVENARVTLALTDPAGQRITDFPAVFGDGDVYRADGWAVPHKLQEGNWTLTVEAQTEAHRGMATTAFRIKNSTSEMLLHKYGFWVDAPTLRGINPGLFKEQGDAQNGVIIWGGQILTQHIFPENWLEVQWRTGDFKLGTEDGVREFMLNELGELGFTPVRELGPFERVKFKDWDAWQVKARGQFLRYDGQWMIFYAPDADKTYAIGTTVVQPPTGIDPHAVLRDGFEVHPEVQAEGAAPKPLPRLLPPPELTSPELGTRFFGIDQPIILTWEPVKELAADEYYLVSIDYNYVEANPRITYTTRETQFTLPESLYSTPNCSVFNWRVTLMQQTGVGEDGQPKGKPLSFNSLYWYIEWFYPPGEEAPFKPLCPNPQV